MEDEVVRLQKEWAAVLEEIKRASDENLILKEILNCQPRSLSYSTSIPGVTPSRTTIFGKSVEETHPDPHLRTTTNTSKLSTPTSMPMPMLLPTSNARATVPSHPPSSNESESFGFFTNPFTSDHNRGGYFQVQQESADKMDGTAFCPFTTVSHCPTVVPSKNPYSDLEPYINPNDPIFPVEQSCLGTGHDTLSPAGPQGYYSRDGMNPQGHGPSHTPSSRPSNNPHIQQPYFFKTRTQPY
jgi:hypothetical protein